MPKIGPLKAAKPKPPTPETTKWFEDSFDKLWTCTARCWPKPGSGQLQLANTNFDTGRPTQPAAYKLADEAYAKLALKLADREWTGVDPKMTDDIVAYFHDVDLSFATKHDSKEWSKTLEAVAKLKSSRPARPHPRANPPTLR